MASSRRGNVVLTANQLARLIDREARKRLDMSGADFVQRYLDGTLEKTSVVRDIGMLVRLGEKSNRHSGSSTLHRSFKRAIELNGHG